MRDIIFHVAIGAACLTALVLIVIVIQASLSYLDDYFKED